MTQTDTSLPQVVQVPLTRDECQYYLHIVMAASTFTNLQQLAEASLHLLHQMILVVDAGGKVRLRKDIRHLITLNVPRTKGNHDVQPVQHPDDEVSFPISPTSRASHQAIHSLGFRWSIAYALRQALPHYSTILAYRMKGHQLIAELKNGQYLQLVVPGVPWNPKHR